MPARDLTAPPPATAGGKHTAATPTPTPPATTPTPPRSTAPPSSSRSTPPSPRGWLFSSEVTGSPTARRGASALLTPPTSSPPNSSTPSPRSTDIWGADGFCLPWLFQLTEPLPDLEPEEPWEQPWEEEVPEPWEEEVPEPVKAEKKKKGRRATKSRRNQMRARSPPTSPRSSGRPDTERQSLMKEASFKYMTFCSDIEAVDQYHH